MLVKYEKWYWNLVSKFEERGWTKKTAPEYVEGHHPFPIGIFGKKENKWKVWITPREHYILHLLLAKFAYLPMPMFWKNYTSRQFSPARALKSKSMRGEKHHLWGVGHAQEVKDKQKLDPRVRSVEGKIGINNGVTYKFIDPAEEVPEGWVKGKLPDSEETKEKKRNVDPSKRAVNKGRQFSQEWIDNMKKAKKNLHSLECPFCGKICRGAAALGSHKRKHDPKKLLEMSLMAQVREANKKSNPA